MTGTVDPSESADRMRVDVLRGTPTGDELAGLIAVVTEAYREESAGATVQEIPGRTAWSLSQRSLRAPLHRDLGWARWSGH
ncbi:acyl-CoA carboxylase subunit epsilon [Microbacterium sp. zg.B48]|uniref:acyl-CoA carboxylase subunit epsilon n=1 Tax=unclassified Microbacterium TaxID=2609290 RepID=UPI00214AB6D9|nr:MULTISPECIES: acyl-CoA carboxylase subunit epsilon [unclassified Microbacterium]MCR2765110.1 acyl-CoA carboxylase subunit epsilon [Microbacterium sp. zg.B48]MCR2810289.1 acyl-CoA carboxylase subunit epsilon [Microbacterium sp. zg.B185]WIM19884.1 acyl-CoA carboxylase subunit epsilon [Microbacterium sp. zg-B185]